jgi:hypothetical protein
MQMYEEAWRDSIQAVVSDLLDVECAIERLPEAHLDKTFFDAPNAGTWFRCTAAGALSGEQVLLVPTADAQRLLGGSGRTHRNLEPAEASAERILSQIAEASAARLGANLGATVNFAFSSATGPFLSPARLLAFLIGVADQEPVRLYILMSAEVENSREESI